MKKKIGIGIGVSLILLIIVGIITNYVDSGKITTGHEPKYCIKVVSNDGGKVTYWGLGYKVIRYVEVSPNEPYENNIGVKMGNWFMKYELPMDSEYNKEKNKDINTLNDFYNTELTQNKDIRHLGQEYSTFDAQKDNCFVIGAMVHNDNLYSEFMDKYNKKENAFIRVVQSTIEGDIFIIDVLYEAKNNKIHLVKDDTRDKFSAKEDRTIKYKTYEKTGVWNYNNLQYWVAYNGELPNNTKAEFSINSDDLLIITTIN